MSNAQAPRESRYVTVARLAYQVAQASLPPYSHPKSPHRFSLPQLAACVMLGFYLNKSYRDTEEFLYASDAICRVLELKTIPDHSTLSRTYKRLKLDDWQRMQATLLAGLRDGEGRSIEEAAVAIDSTYFAGTQASLAYLTRRGRTLITPFKGAYAVGTQSRLILATCCGVGTGKDGHDLPVLRRVAGRYGVLTATGRRWQLRLTDRGFDGRNVRDGDLTPPIRRNGRLKDPARIARMELVSQARLDGLYGQRWQVETVNSVIKRKFGQAVRSHEFWRQRREAAVRALVYNLHVVCALLRTLLQTLPAASQAASSTA